MQSPWIRGNAMTEFRFGDATYILGDFIKIQTIEHVKYWGMIQSIETKLIEDSACTIIKIRTLYGDVCININEIEFLEGEC